jgi:Bacteriophage replication gene A protein (GPA)
VKVARLSEAAKVRALEVSKVAGQAYCSNTAVARRIEQTQANAAMLANTYLSNGEGYTATLQELVDKSTASKPIRRGELMTRIRGCEDIAQTKKSTSLFFTLTCPSKFHPVTIDGKANAKYEGNTAKDGQAWLTDKWEKVRAKFKRKGIEVYGVRVAEPHHDNCPHWHVLLWCEQQHGEAVQGAIRDAWLSEYGDERGAKEYRVKCEIIKPRNEDGTGGAAAYLAKYVAKNIDDYKTKEHKDEVGGEQLDIFGDGVITPATRVEAWATHWGIRQFQTFGMPPVGVWRELRRLKHEDVLKSKDKRLLEGWIATQKIADKGADWAAYTMAQGGVGAAGSHRNCKIRLMRRMMEREGRYQVIMDKSPIGVRCGAARVLSNRKDWNAVSVEEVKEIRSAGKSGAKRPRTRFNNCTPSNGTAFGGIVQIVKPYDSLEGATWHEPRRRHKPMQLF